MREKNTNQLKKIGYRVLFYLSFYVIIFVVVTCIYQYYASHPEEYLERMKYCTFCWDYSYYKAHPKNLPALIHLDYIITLGFISVFSFILLIKTVDKD